MENSRIFEVPVQSSLPTSAPSLPQLQLVEQNFISLSCLSSPSFLSENLLAYSSSHHLCLYSLSTQKHKVQSIDTQTKRLLGVKALSERGSVGTLVYLASTHENRYYCVLRYPSRNQPDVQSEFLLHHEEQLLDFVFVPSINSLALIIKLRGQCFLRVTRFHDQQVSERPLQGNECIAVLGGLSPGEFYVASQTSLWQYKQCHSLPVLIQQSDQRIVYCTTIPNALVVVREHSLTTYSIDRADKLIQRQTPTNINQLKTRIVTGHVDIDGEFLIIGLLSCSAILINLETLECLKEIQLTQYLSSLSCLRISPKGYNLLLLGESPSKEPIVSLLDLNLLSCKSQHYYPCYHVTSLSLTPNKILYSYHQYRKGLALLTTSRFIFGTTEEVFTETPVTFSVHPTGYFVVVGFKYLIKLYGIKCKKLQLIMTISSEGIQKLQYTSYGNLIVGYWKQGVKIFNSSTFEEIRKVGLRFPATQIQGFQIQEKGSRIFLYDNGLGATVYDLMLQKLETEFRLQISASVVHYDFESNTVILIDSSRIVVYKVSTTFRRQVKYQDNTQVTAIKISNQLGKIFFGTRTGEVRCHIWTPQLGSQFIRQYSTVSIFACSISSIELRLGSREHQLSIYSCEGSYAIVRVIDENYSLPYTLQQNYLVLQSADDQNRKIALENKCASQQWTISQMTCIVDMHRAQLDIKLQRYLKDLQGSCNGQSQQVLLQLHSRIRSMEDQLASYSCRTDAQSMRDKFYRSLFQVEERKKEITDRKRLLLIKNQNQIFQTAKELKRLVLQESNTYQIKLMGMCAITQQAQCRSVISSECRSIMVQELRVDASALDEVTGELADQIRRHSLLEASNLKLTQEIKNYGNRVSQSEEIKNLLQDFKESQDAELKCRSEVKCSLRGKLEQQHTLMEDNYSRQKITEIQYWKNKSSYAVAMLENLTSQQNAHLASLCDHQEMLNNKAAQIEQSLVREVTTSASLNKDILEACNRTIKCKQDLNKKKHQVYMKKYNLEKFRKEVLDFKHPCSKPRQSSVTKSKVLQDISGTRLSKRVQIDTRQKQYEAAWLKSGQQSAKRFFRRYNAQGQSLTNEYNHLNLRSVENKQIVDGLMSKLSKLRLSHHNKQESCGPSGGFRSPFVEYQERKKLSLFRSHNVSLDFDSL